MHDPATVLGAVLQRERQRLFVGRTAERALFAAAAQAKQLPFHVLLIHGPGGIGKSTLLASFAAECVKQHVAYTTVLLDLAQPDARSSSTTLLRTIQPSTTRRVVLLDTVDSGNAWHDFETWLRVEALADLPTNTLVVIASRSTPAHAWHTDPGWHAVTHILALRNLNPAESQAYLAMRGIDAAQHPNLLAFTHGHPLALALSADLLLQQPAATPTLHQVLNTDLIPHLLAALLDHIPDATHRAAVELAGIVQTVREALLAHVLPEADAHALFRWLQGCSFITVHPGGLAPHDLVRTAIVADLRWRNPARFHELRSLAGQYIVDQLRTDTTVQTTLLTELAYVYRHSAVFSAFVPLDAHPEGLYIEPAQPTDVPDILMLIRHYEGPESAAIAQRWLVEQPGAVTVVRDHQVNIGAVLPTTIAAFSWTLLLTAEDAARCDFDPYVQAVWRYTQVHAPLATHELMSIGRFWLARDTHQQASPLASTCFVLQTRQYLTTPNLAWSSNYFFDPQPWLPILEFTNFPLLSDTTFTVDNRCCTPNAHDWRKQPAHAWFEMILLRTDGTAQPVPHPPAGQPQLAALSKPDFHRAVRHALRHMNRLDLLAQNPLIHARFVARHITHGTTGTACVLVLQERLRSTVEALRETPRDLRLYRALLHAFLQPDPTHQHAARALHVSLSTFRRDMRAGAATVAALLWLEEC